MRGLLASVLGGVSRGVGEVAAGQIELNSRRALMEAEEEMRARIAEAAETRAETRQIAAEEREIENVGRLAEAEEGVLKRRYAEGSSYPGLISRELQARETPAQKAARQRDEALFEDEQSLRELRQTIATMPKNDPALPGLERELEIRTGGSRRIDPMIELELEDIQQQVRRATADYERATSNYDDEAMTAAGQKLDDLNARRERLFGRLPVITTQEQYDNLPAGSRFIEEDGQVYIKE
jgi:hypothetical protein